MKKTIALILTLTLLVGNTVFANTTENISLRSTAPTVKSAKYYHENEYVSMINNTLSIIWGKVDKAQSYEILIVKANGQRKIYKQSASYNCILIPKSSKDSFSGCPTFYNKKTGEWESATVRVRAVYKYGIRGRWSKKKTISCNALLHTTKE
jgi:uncharacterized protein YxeA